MARVFYDLSDTLSNDTSAFEFNKHEITYLTPELTAAQSAEWGLGPDYWPDGVALSAEVVTLSTHSGTHVDAPFHYGPAVAGHTRTIDEVPLEWCYGPGVLLDFAASDRAPGSGARTSRPSSRGSGTAPDRSTSCSSGPAPTCACRVTRVGTRACGATRPSSSSTAASS